MENPDGSFKMLSPLRRRVGNPRKRLTCFLIREWRCRQRSSWRIRQTQVGLGLHHVDEQRHGHKTYLQPSCQAFRFVSQANQFGMAWMMLFHPANRQRGPLIRSVLVAQTRVRHGQEEMIERCAAHAERGSTIKGFDGRLELISAVASSTERVPVGAALRDLRRWSGKPTRGRCRDLLRSSPVRSPRARPDRSRNHTIVSVEAASSAAPTQVWLESRAA